MKEVQAKKSQVRTSFLNEPWTLEDHVLNIKISVYVIEGGFYLLKLVLGCLFCHIGRLFK